MEAVKARYERLEDVGGVVHVPEAVLEHHLSDIFVRVSYPSFPMLFIVDIGVEIELGFHSGFPRRGQRSAPRRGGAEPDYFFM